MKETLDPVLLEEEDPGESPEENWEDEEDDQAPEGPAPSLCQACHGTEIDRSESIHSVLCKACREKMIRRPVPKVLLVAALGIVVLVAAALFRLPGVLDSYRVYADAPRLAQSGDPEGALGGLFPVLEKYPDSIPVAERMADIAMQSGYYDAASYIIGTYLAGKSVDGSMANKINGYIDRIDRYYTTQSAFEEISLGVGEDLTPEDAQRFYREKLTTLLDDPAQDGALLHFYLASFSSTTAQQKEHLLACLEQDATMLFAKTALAVYHRREGDLEGAEALLKEVLRENSRSTDAKRALATVRLVQDRREEALPLAREAYTDNPEGLYNWETYAIALWENGQADEARALIAEQRAGGNELEEDAQAYFDGKVSIWDYYIGFEEGG